MENIASAKAVKELCERYGFAFSKSLGQNFLINPSVCPRIAELGGAEGANVLEIGPGFGVLTRELARRASRERNRSGRSPGAGRNPGRAG